jgi:hypothetical protein
MKQPKPQRPKRILDLLRQRSNERNQAKAQAILEARQAIREAKNTPIISSHTT